MQVLSVQVRHCVFSWKTGRIETMKTLRQVCKPRKSVFEGSRGDVALDIMDLLDPDSSIDALAFFEENYQTNGMKQLIRDAFRRFAGESSQGVFILSQAMGGGKTHNMIALGLLAAHRELRKDFMENASQFDHVEPVTVVGFTGRETDHPLGIWGAIAERLGKKDLFNEYYSPLSAPGPRAWINLLKGGPLLILLDELPPYFEYAKSRQIGNSDLSQVSTAALSNLLVAVNKQELSNVCVVISDLKATYQGGSEQINRALENFENEVGRTALTLEPVGLNTDDIYHILRKRLFEELPNDMEKWEVAKAYAQAVRDARQIDITKASPERFAEQLKESYPFHFAIRDLYARFRENPGFQQTRGLIRLMRVLTSRIFEEGGKADTSYLIHAHDLDLNDSETLAEITQINPTLDNAISHDIASGGQAVAEIMDSNTDSTNAQDACKLILVSSLANVPGGIVGLSHAEIISYLCSPNRDISRLPKEVLGTLLSNAWYLHANREGKLYFKNVQNLVAKLKTTAEGYTPEISLKELKSFLIKTFTPSIKDCYQEVLALPAIDEINIKSDKVTLIISAPNAGGLHPDLRKFYQDLDFKNRVLFLSGARGTLDKLLEGSAYIRAINYILAEMNAEKVAENDLQRLNALELLDRANLQLLSALRETFTTLTYPHTMGLGGAGLIDSSFVMNFIDNKYNGEKQVRETLKSKRKFTEDISDDSFRSKCEQRLFTQKSMPWPEIKRRAATQPNWQWHHPDALDMLKVALIHKGQWREDGGYVEKPPFPKPETRVLIQDFQRNDDTGVATLRLTPINGDIIYCEVGSPATSASRPVQDMKFFETDDLELSFLCADSKGEHPQGPPQTWRNRITLKHRVYQNGSEKMVELLSAPKVPMRYTTDGSDPRIAGGLYNNPFTVPPGTIYVLAVGQKNELLSEVHRVNISWDKKEDFSIDTVHPLAWIHQHKLDVTKDVYELMGRMKKYQVCVLAAHVTIAAQAHWLELTFDDTLPIEADKLENAIDNLRALLPEGQVSIEANTFQFPTGQRFLDWIAEVRVDLKSEEVEQ